MWHGMLLMVRGYAASPPPPFNSSLQRRVRFNFGFHAAPPAPCPQSGVAPKRLYPRTLKRVHVVGVGASLSWVATRRGCVEALHLHVVVATTRRCNEALHLRGVVATRGGCIGVGIQRRDEARLRDLPPSRWG